MKKTNVLVWMIASVPMLGFAPQSLMSAAHADEVNVSMDEVHQGDVSQGNGDQGPGDHQGGQGGQGQNQGNGQGQNHGGTPNNGPNNGGPNNGGPNNGGPNHGDPNHGGPVAPPIHGPTPLPGHPGMGPHRPLPGPFPRPIPAQGGYYREILDNHNGTVTIVEPRYVSPNREDLPISGLANVTSLDGVCRLFGYSTYTGGLLQGNDGNRNQWTAIVNVYGQFGGFSQGLRGWGNPSMQELSCE